MQSIAKIKDDTTNANKHNDETTYESIAKIKDDTTRSTQSAKQQQHEVHYSNNDGRTSMHIYIHTAHVHTPFMFK